MNQDMFTAPTTQPEHLVRVTAHELATLFHVATPPQAQRTREAMGLPELAADDQVLTASLSSLVLRGLAHDQGGRLLPVGGLAALCKVLFTATRWIEAVATTNGQRQGALVVDSPQGGALLEWQPSGIWQALPITPQTDPITTAAGYIAASYQTLTGRPFGGAITLTHDQCTRTAGIRIDDDETWTLTSGPVDNLTTPRRITADDQFHILVEELS